MQSPGNIRAEGTGRTIKTKSSNIEWMFDLELVSSPRATGFTVNYLFVLDRCKSCSSKNNYVLKELGIHWENANETEQKKNPNTISVMFFLICLNIVKGKKTNYEWNCYRQDNVV